MNVEQLKFKLKELLGAQITFNRNFDNYIKRIKNIDYNLIKWCTKLKNKEISPKPAPNLENGIVFIKKIGSSNRCVIIKIINEEFKEIHLADHDYYNKLRKKLGLKKSSKDY